jgi:hypothetical protein
MILTSIIQKSGNNSGGNKVEASDQSRCPQEPFSTSWYTRA